jgi:hypothetical protein
MPKYTKDNFKESNVNYLNKDFDSLKQSLMNYAKSYFPDTYKDFNETSPGMMLLEMNAYVGDVLSFYIDQQYREMILPLSEERRNIINMAKMFGYKVKPIIPSYVDLTFKSNVDADSNDASKINYQTAGVFDAGIEIKSSVDSDIIFTTLDPVDFTITGSADTNVVGAIDNVSGLATSYTLSRTVKAVSATQKTKSFQIGTPEKFKKITIPDTNVVDIVSCVDTNGNNWYEVDFLAQDKVPIPTHWTSETGRNSAYQNLQTQEIESIAVPYSLTYIKTTKRFTRETNLDNTTSLVFGNGVLKNGEIIDENYIDMEQIGIVVPGQTNDLNQSIDPLLGDEYSTLGETPNNTTLTITYRVGGGINSNLPTNTISTTPSVTPIGGAGAATITSVTNEIPARGGRNQEEISEIREKAKAFFTTQNRCVTKEDYEARVLNIPARYGNIAKAYVSRRSDEGGVEFQTIEHLIDNLGTMLTTNERYLENIEIFLGNVLQGVEELDYDFVSSFIATNDSFFRQSNNELNQMQNIYNQMDLLGVNRSGVIDIYALAYNNQKQLVGNPHTSTTFTNDNLPGTLTKNILNYLDNFRILTDMVSIQDGYIVNFGVFFDIIAEKYADKQQVKLRCIDVIKEYFRIEKMQFNQPIYKSQLEFELMGVEGVRSIGHVTITQNEDYFYDDGETLLNRTYSYSYDQTTKSYIDVSGATGAGEGTVGYGYKYDFQNALTEDETVIRPPLSSTPAVFELKNPNTNIQGRVR